MFQILPYYVVEVAGSIPGISGLFIAGVFAAALSTMSANLNTVAGTIYEDFIKHRFVKFQRTPMNHFMANVYISRNPNTSEKRASNIMKVLLIAFFAISPEFNSFFHSIDNCHNLGNNRDVFGVRCGEGWLHF